MAKRFARKKEDFICENCGAKTVGNGYTNHCPRCLWSKHVDVNPGDRAETCGGSMEPIAVEFKSGKHQIVHRCTRCQMERKNKLSEADSMEAVIEIAKKRS